VKPSYGLTDLEIQSMVNASATHAEEDIRYRQLVEARNSAEPVLRAVERKLPDARRLLSPEELARVETCFQELKAALEREDPVRITEAKNELNNSTVHLAELVVKEIIASRASNTS
jgi:molecular chaperone DnaK/molecular chaperone HscA